MFISLDDKHRIKITEPGFPVERGKRVIVSMLNDFVVVIMICDRICKKSLS